MYRSLKPVRTVDPGEDVISLAEAKAHLDVDYDDDDTLISSLIRSATGLVDGYSGILNRGLVTQNWAERFPFFQYEMPLRLGPVQSVSSVTYYDADDAEQTVDSGVYRLHETASGAYLVPKSGQSWPSTYSRDDAVTVTYVVGYGDTGSDVPQPIRNACLMLIRHWYDNPSAVGAGMAEMPFAVHACLAPYKRGKYR